MRQFHRIVVARLNASSVGHELFILTKLPDPCLCELELKVVPRAWVTGSLSRSGGGKPPSNLMAPDPLLQLTAILPSLQVLSGDGGVTPVTPVDKAAIKPQRSQESSRRGAPASSVRS